MAKNKATNHYLFSHGNHYNLYNYFGAHKRKDDDGSVYTVFRVWAPNADSVFVVGDFNNWEETCMMKKTHDEGIWQASVPLDFSNGDKIRYKYLIFNKSKITVKADPFALYGECADDGASYLYEPPASDSDDAVWLASRGRFKSVNSALNIYEFDPGTFYRNRGGSFMTYAALADMIAPYMKKMGFTHVKMPVFTRCDGQGKITAGRFSVDSRFGTPEDLTSFVLKMHRYSVGVIFDVPLLGFEESESGLNEFDGGAIYDRKENGEYRTFDIDKNEVVSFLISGIVMLAAEYRADGICLDLSRYSMSDDGHRSKSVSTLLKKITRVLYEKYPDVLLICEPGPVRSAITKPLFSGGMGFDYVIDKARTGDTSTLSAPGPGQVSMLASRFDENYIIPIRPTDRVLKERFSSLSDKISFYRAYLLFTTCIPGKRSVYSGCEYADFDGRKTSALVNWYNASSDLNSKALVFSSDLNYFYLNSQELWGSDSGWNGFKLLKNEKNLTAFVRYCSSGFVVCVFNFTREASVNRIIGVPKPGFYSEVFSTTSPSYGGSGGLSLPIRAKNSPCDGCDCSLTVDVLPYSGSVYKSESLINKF